MHAVGDNPLSDPMTADLGSQTKPDFIQVSPLNYMLRTLSVVRRTIQPIKRAGNLNKHDCSNPTGSALDVLPRV